MKIINKKYKKRNLHIYTISDSFHVLDFLLMKYGDEIINDFPERYILNLKCS